MESNNAGSVVTRKRRKAISANFEPLTVPVEETAVTAPVEASPARNDDSKSRRLSSRKRLFIENTDPSVQDSDLFLSIADDNENPQNRSDVSSSSSQLIESEAGRYLANFDDLAKADEPSDILRAIMNGEVKEIVMAICEDCTERLSQTHKQRLKENIVQFVVHAMGCPFRSRLSASWDLNAIKEADGRLDFAEEAGEKMPWQQDHRLEAGIVHFFFYAIQALTKKFNDELDDGFLEVCVGLCQTLICCSSQYARHTGFKIFRAVARALFVVMDKLFEKMKEPVNIRHLKHAQEKLAKGLLRTVNRLMGIGLLDDKYSRSVCFHELTFGIDNYRRVVLTKETLDLLIKSLTVADEDYHTQALEFIVERVKHMEAEDSEAIVTRCVKKMFKFLCTNIQRAKSNLQRCCISLLRFGMEKNWWNGEEVESLKMILFKRMCLAELPVAKEAADLFKELNDCHSIISDVVQFALQMGDTQKAVDAAVACIDLATFPSVEHAIAAAKASTVDVAQPLIQAVTTVLKSRKTFTKKISKLMERETEELINVFKEEDDMMETLMELFKLIDLSIVNHKKILRPLKKLVTEDQKQIVPVLSVLQNCKKPEELSELVKWLQDVEEELGDLDNKISDFDVDAYDPKIFDDYLSSLIVAEAVPRIFKKSWLLSPSPKLLYNLVEKTNLEDVNDEVVLLLSAIQKNNCYRMGLLTRDKNLCRKVFQEDSFDTVMSNWQDLKAYCIGSQQEVLRSNSADAAVKLQVLSHLFEVLDEHTDHDSKLICKSLKALLLHPDRNVSSKCSVKMRKGILWEILHSTSCFVSDPLIARTLLLSSTTKAFRKVILGSFKRLMTGVEAKSKTTPNDANKRTILFFPFDVLLQVLVDEVEEKEGSDDCIALLQQTAAALTKANLKEHGKQLLMDFCLEIVKSALEKDELNCLLTVVPVFATELSSSNKRKLRDELHRDATANENFVEYCRKNLGEGPLNFWGDEDAVDETPDMSFDPPHQSTFRKNLGGSQASGDHSSLCSIAEEENEDSEQSL